MDLISFHQYPQIVDGDIRAWEGAVDLCGVILLGRNSGSFFSHIKKKILFIFRERGREGERGRKTSVCGYISHAPYWRPGLQPRHVP